MNDALGYVRVSSEEQADSGLGLEAQRQRIAAYCAMKGLRLAEVFADPGISGGKPLASRSAGSQLLAAANKSKAFVIVAKLDRLFRSVERTRPTSSPTRAPTSNTVFRTYWTPRPRAPPPHPPCSHKWPRRAATSDARRGL